LTNESSFLTLPQRLHGFFIVYDLYKAAGIKENPFMPFFVSHVESFPIGDEKIPVEKQIESYFCVQLLFSLEASSFQLSTPAIFIRNFLSKKPDPSHLPTLGKIKGSFRIPEQKLAPIRALGVQPFIQDTGFFKPSKISNLSSSASSSQKSKNFVHDFNLQQEITLHSYDIHFGREAPLLFPLQHEELEWILPDLPLRLHWDDSMKATLDADEVGSLMAIALQQQLREEEADRLLQNLKEDREAVTKYGLTPEQLPDLIKYNPNIAYECLHSLINTPQIANFYQALASMDMSVHQVGLHSMEVVNKLTTTVTMPKQFLHLYIMNCIRSCESITDPFFQTRLVRLVCVFLQSLIRSHIIDIEEVFIEVQAFCIEFSRIREAAGLFKLIKGLQNMSATNKDDNNETNLE